MGRWWKMQCFDGSCLLAIWCLRVELFFLKFEQAKQVKLIFHEPLEPIC